MHGRLRSDRLRWYASPATPAHRQPPQGSESVVAIQFNLNFRMIFIIQINRQANLFLLRGLLGRKAFRNQAFQSALEHGDIQLFLAIEICAIVAFFFGSNGILRTIKRNVDLLDVCKVCAEHLKMTKRVVRRGCQRFVIRCRYLIDDLAIPQPARKP